MTSSSISDCLQDLMWKDEQGDSSADSIFRDWETLSKFVSWVVTELKAVCSVDEEVTKVQGNHDVTSFKMELTSLLKEMNFPYHGIIDLPLNERFLDLCHRKTCCLYLLTELQAARIEYSNRPKKMKLELEESKTARHLKEIMQTLGFGPPPGDISVKELFITVAQKIPSSATLPPLFVGQLSPRQWQTLQTFCDELKAEYRARRDMLLTRLDATTQSFGWSERMQNRQEDISAVVNKHRDRMNVEPSVDVCDILSSRLDLPIEEKTSCSEVRKNTRSQLNKVRIGRVPDRGGRPDEAQPPPPEMPSWQQRQPDNNRGGFRGGGRGDFGGRRSGTKNWTRNQQPTTQHTGSSDFHSQQRNRVQGNWADRGQYQNSGYSRNQGHEGGQHSSHQNYNYNQNQFADNYSYNGGNFQQGFQNYHSEQNNYQHHYSGRRGGHRGSHYNRGR